MPVSVGDCVPVTVGESDCVPVEEDELEADCDGVPDCVEVGEAEVHTAEPAEDEVPGAQELQVEEPELGEKVPGAQGVQAEAPAPEKEPGGQMAAVALREVPAGQK